MPLMKESLRTGRAKCYLHEMQRPLELPYDRFKYNICLVCQTRLLELGKADVQFQLRGQVISISAAPEVQEKKADPNKGYKIKVTQKVQKEAA